MTYDLLKLAEECALFFNTNRSESAKRTMRAVATALREAHAEIEQLRAELEAAKCLSKHAVECMDRCCPQCNAAMKEKA